MMTGDQKVQRTLKKQTIRGLLQDKKVPGTSRGTRAAEAPARAQGLLQDSREKARLGYVSSQVLIWTSGARIRRIYQKEKENRDTHSLVRELSAAAAASGAPSPSVPGL